MFEAALTERLQRMLVHASEEARRLQSPEVEPEHLFLGLLSQTQGVAAAVLDHCGVDSIGLREAILADEPRTSTHTPRHLAIPHSADTYAVFTHAEAEAAGLSAREVCGEHLLLGLLQAPKERLSRVLLRYGLTRDAVRVELLRLLPVDRPTAWTDPAS